MPTRTKIGARHSEADRKRIQTVHDAMSKLGATCGCAPDATVTVEPGDIVPAITDAIATGISELIASEVMKHRRDEVVLELIDDPAARRAKRIERRLVDRMVRK
jgi:hypothetical protein